MSMETKVNLPVERSIFEKIVSYCLSGVTDLDLLHHVDKAISNINYFMIYIYIENTVHNHDNDEKPNSNV